MNFFKKLGKVLTSNMAYTIVFVVSFILFIYFAKGDIIRGALTALSALIAYISAVLIYHNYKHSAKPVAKAKKATRKK